MKKRFEQRIISKLIAEQLIEEKLAAKSIVISDDEVEVKIAEIAEQRKVSRDKLLAEAARQGISQADTKEQIKWGLRIDKLIEAEIGDEANVTDEDAKKYYDKNTQRFSTPEQVRASHILIKAGKDEAGMAAAKAKIEDILKQAREGADFAELAKTYTEDPRSKKTGGEYTFSRGRMAPAFERTAFSLEIGQISGPVRTRSGYHIVKLHEKIAPKRTSFEEAREGIKENLAKRKKGEFFRKFQQALKDEAKIEYAEGKEPPAKPTRPTTPKAGPTRTTIPPKPPKPQAAPTTPAEDKK
jgi:parvulin-like peptidyl-prolyl isomerase